MHCSNERKYPEVMAQPSLNTVFDPFIQLHNLFTLLTCSYLSLYRLWSYSDRQSLYSIRNLFYSIRNLFIQSAIFLFISAIFIHCYLYVDPPSFYIIYYLFFSKWAWPSRTTTRPPSRSWSTWRTSRRRGEGAPRTGSG